ncbi:suppressor of fused domain protein [Nakamurella antarctica]|uniref:Suppressor of fused domain protein n=1 Tax=Nakamurella antarctica TaxID=1902245 RepID=A0A3G8ZNX1_9ACTN|nr:suppressor of fused domain protein [Nakamurella antarctica]AZI58828.1 suppressor of fused domain protein [Nakamurella antarctica]
MTRVGAVVEHFSRLLGEGSRVDVVGGVELWKWVRPEFVSFSTVGLCDSPVTAVFPQELVCSVKAGQEGAADYLLRLSLQMVLDGSRGFVAGDLVANGGQVLLTGTLIEGVLLSAHPFMPDHFNVIAAEPGGQPVEILTLVPVTGGEVALANSESVDSLMDVLEKKNPDLADIERACSTQDPLSVEELRAAVAAAVAADYDLGWRRVEITANILGQWEESVVVGFDAAGDAYTLPESRGVVRALALMRPAMATPEVGAWFTATVVVDRLQDLFTIDFEYDADPVWVDRPYDVNFIDDEVSFPRPYSQIPRWHPVRENFTEQEWATTLANQ